MNVQNGCERNGRRTSIQGTATPIPPYAGYGHVGVLRVQFPRQPAPDCPGPNYIVQDIGPSIDAGFYGGVAANNDNAFAIVQTNNFTTLFLLSRNRNPSNASIEVCMTCRIVLKKSILIIHRHGLSVQECKAQISTMSFLQTRPIASSLELQYAWINSHLPHYSRALLWQIHHRYLLYHCNTTRNLMR